MSTDTPVVLDATTVAPRKLNAIEMVEQELGNFIKQREAAAKQAEQSIANVHAVDGAIQGTRYLLDKLKAEAAKAVLEVAKIADAVEGEVSKGIHVVEAEIKKLV